MPYPLRAGMTTAEFKTEILEYYFPTLCTGVNAKFAADYAAIGAFLTRKDEVLAALAPLETKLRELALENARQANPSGPTPVQSATLYTTKANTRKILTRALEDVETLAGFNKARTGLLHDSATIGSGSGTDIDMTATGRTTAGKRGSATDATLPQGVPKIIGSIHPTDFMLLLKHGYAFKDVGAESKHGEFTHRLQWYAIIKSKGALALQNEPIDLYQKMWFAATKGTAHLEGNKGLYMWMALFDNVTSEDEANNLSTMAWSPHTFNNPEQMTSELTRKIFGQPGQLDPASVSNLHVLRRLLRARLEKRDGSFDGNEAYHQKKIVGTPGTKTVLDGYGSVGTRSVNDLKNVVAWIERL